ncbi:MAG: aminotransferase class V-fold PLP-dependent enzyme [Pirellulales bacterium]
MMSSQSTSSASTKRCYLDHAATSWPKPPGVVQACIDFQNNYGTSIGRSPTTVGLESLQLVQQTRALVARWIGAASGDCIAFTSNGTQALNASLLGILQPGDHVVTSTAEHNSLLRPLASLQKHRNVSWTAVPVDSTGLVSADAIASSIRPTTRLIAITHASNVTGTIQPIESIGQIAARHHIPFLVDAAQTIGYIPIDVEHMKISLLAAPGHKGLGAMQGTGILYLHPSLGNVWNPPWIGGTGSESENIDGPFPWNDALESGNLNGPAIASLHAGITWLFDQKLERLQDHWNSLLSHLLECLTRDEFRIIGPDRNGARVPVVSVVASSMGVQEWMTLLDSLGIETRAGFHCAGMIHKDLGTSASGGTLRFSLGHTSHLSDIVRLKETLDSILGPS